MITSILSLALNKPVAQGIALTGEVTLRGKILPIGGVKEKVLAALREGIKVVILPKENEKDYEKLPEFMRKETSVRYVDEYADVFKVAFLDQPIAEGK